MRVSENQLREMVRSVLEASKERRQQRRAVAGSSPTLARIAQTAYDLVAKNGLDPIRYAFTMTSIEKVGINPMSRYNTPVAIYAYPATLQMVDKLLGGTYRDLGQKTQQGLRSQHELAQDPDEEVDPDRFVYYFEEEEPELPFAGDQPYVNFFEITDLSEVFYTSVGMSADKYKSAIDALYAWFKDNVRDSEHLDTFKKLLTAAQQHNKVNTQGQAVQALSANMTNQQRLDTIWTLCRAVAHFKGGQNYTEIVAGRLEGGTPAMSSLWRSLLLRAGVRAVVDDEGVGLIHTSEKIQLCVLDPAIIRVISRFDNKTPARGAAPKSPEQMKRDIQNAKDTSIIRQADLVDLVDNANKWAQYIIVGRNETNTFRHYLMMMNASKDINTIRKRLNVPNLIAALKRVGEISSVGHLVELTALAWGPTENQELLDNLLDQLLTDGPFSDRLNFALAYANSLAQSSDPARKGRFIREVVKQYVMRTKDQAAQAPIEATRFITNLAYNKQLGHESVDVFNYSTFMQAVSPMIRSMYGDDRARSRPLADGISTIFRSHKKFKDPEDSPVGLKKKALEKMAKAAKNVDTLMPVEDKYGAILHTLHGLSEHIKHMIELAEEYLLEDDKHVEVDKILTLYNLTSWSDSMWSNIKYHVGNQSPTGMELSELLDEFNRTCRKIVSDTFPVTNAMEKVRSDMGVDVFDPDATEEYYRRFTALLKEHQQGRIDRLKRALETLVSRFGDVLRAKGADSKRSRAERGLYETHLRQIIRETLMSEGGLKLPPEHRRDLTPKLVSEAVAVYKQFLSGFNAWLAERGKAPIDPVRPTGSSTHAERDIVDRPGATYGDIDYLVSFPVDYTGTDLTSRRKEEAGAVREYTELLTQYLASERPPGVDVELTLGGHPLMIIVKLPSGGLAQVDTVVTHPSYTEWMKGRYTPERGVKGYVTGNLYKALGDYFTLSIGTEGVLARIKDGKRVPSKIRAGVEYQSVSTDFRTFLRDIADYIIGREDYEPDPLLLQHSGLDPDTPDVGDLAQGIVGLARTLEAVGVADSREMLNTILSNFLQGMEDNVSRKTAREITPEQEEKMRKLNATQGARVEQIFRGSGHI